MLPVFITCLSPDAGIWSQLRTDTQSVFPGRPGDVVPEIVAVINPDFVVVRKLMADRRFEVRFDCLTSNVKVHAEINTGLGLQRFGRPDAGFHAVIQADILRICAERRCPHIWLSPCIVIQTEGLARFETAAETVLAVIAFNCRTVTHPGSQLIIKAVIFQHTVHVVAVIIKPGGIQTAAGTADRTVSAPIMANAVVSVRDECSHS